MPEQQKRVVIQATDDEFFNAYQIGYLRYVTQFKGTSLSDDTIHQIVSNALADTTHPPRYNIGYVAGWFAGLYNKSYKYEDQDVKLRVVK